MGHEMETGVMIVVYSIIMQMTVFMLIVIIVIIKVIIAIRKTIIVIVSSGLAAIEELHMLLQTSLVTPRRHTGEKRLRKGRATLNPSFTCNNGNSNNKINKVNNTSTRSLKAYLDCSCLSLHDCHCFSAIV